MQDQIVGIYTMTALHQKKRRRLPPLFLSSLLKLLLERKHGLYGKRTFLGNSGNVMCFATYRI